VRRRSARVLAAFAASTIGLTGLDAQPSPAQGRAERPNVVLIVMDDMGFMDLGVNGSRFYDTPAIDALANRGARFTQFYTASPVCSPTRASLMTGRAPARLQITDWIGGSDAGALLPPANRMALSDSEQTIGEVFRDAGYATAYIGKWHLGDGAHLPASQGFGTTFAVNHAGEPGSFFAPYARASWPITNVPDLEGDSAGSYLTDRLTDRAITFLQASRNQPFLLVLSHYAVHTPIQAPDSLVAPYRIKAAALGPADPSHFHAEHAATTKLRQDHPIYAAMVRSSDESVRRIVRTLDSLAIARRTIVVFLSDNGGLSTLLQRAANAPTSNAPLRAGKGWLYEGGIRAPLIISWPGRLSAGQRIDLPTTSTDLLPTIAELAGLRPRWTRPLDGRSVAPVLRGQRMAPTLLAWHFPHYHGSGSMPSSAVRLGNLKLVHWYETGHSELYDLARDPREQQDLAASRPREVRRLEAALTAWRQQVSAQLPVPNPNPPLSFVDLATRGDGAPVYRIPALTRTVRGTLLAAYDARPTMADVPSHIRIVLRRSEDGGRTWGPQVVVRQDTAPLGFGDPSLLVDRQTGRIFLFHAASVTQGFFGGAPGNRDDDPNVLHADVSWSDDDGRTWQHRRLTSMIKDSRWGGIFAASGEGIQLQRGRYAGRLIQQFVIRQEKANYAASLVSDDHGNTWRMGALVGPGTDENKTVELADGRMLLNSRARPFRLVAESQDGGLTYGPMRVDSTLIDPANNGAIVSMRIGSQSVLVFSNTADRAARRRLTLRLSCDQGRTWPHERVLLEGSAAYSTITDLGDGQIGVLFERGDYEAITFVRVPLAAIGRCH
jgi:sialidase-1